MKNTEDYGSILESDPVGKLMKDYVRILKTELKV